MKLDGKRMSLEKAKAYLQNLKNRGNELKMLINPHNRYVIRVVAGPKGDYDVVDEFWIEGLTPNTQDIILDMADDVDSGRFW